MQIGRPLRQIEVVPEKMDDGKDAPAEPQKVAVPVEPEPEKIGA